jgi:hypothetical protein
MERRGTASMNDSRGLPAKVPSRLRFSETIQRGQYPAPPQVRYGRSQGISEWPNEVPESGA